MNSIHVAAFIVLALSGVVLAWAVWLHYRNRGDE